MSDANKKLVEEFGAALQRGDPADAARRFHRQYRSNSWGGDLMTTWEKMQAWAASGALSDLEVVSQELVSEGDRVVARTHFRATHSGELFAVPASGRRIDFHSLEMWRVQDGKLVEHWGGIREAVRLYEQLSQQE
jgi:predicted ester cyclase